MSIKAAITTLRDTADFADVIKAIPYARFMGITAEVVDGDVRGKMSFADHLVGNAHVGALHGGTLGALLESTAIFKLLWEGETEGIPKTINVTIEYLRGAKLEDTFARAELTRHGRRVANVRVFAWQEDPERPVAIATTHFLLVGD